MRHFEISAEQRDMLGRVGKLAEAWGPRVQEWDTENVAPLAELLEAGREAELIGIAVPTAYGGLGKDIIDYALCVEEICRLTHSWLPAEILFRTSGPGPTIILSSRHEECRAKFLPDIVSGRKTCAIALTEPDHGSGLTDLETVAIEDGDSYVLNGTKRFVTGSPEDDLYATFVRFGDTPGAAGIGALIVEKDLPGCTAEPGVEVFGARGTPHGNLHFDNCRVPKENLVTESGHFAELMEAFNVERMHNSALSVGLAHGAYDMAVDYTEKRKQFGRPVVEFQAVYHELAEMWVKIEAARQLVYKAALNATDGKFPKGLDVSIAKLFANEKAREVIWSSMELHGGDGVTKDYLVELSFRDVLAACFGGGTSGVAKNVIAAQLLDRKFSQRRG